MGIVLHTETYLFSDLVSYVYRSAFVDFIHVDDFILFALFILIAGSDAYLNDPAGIDQPITHRTTKHIAMINPIFRLWLKIPVCIKLHQSGVISTNERNLLGGQVMYWTITKISLEDLSALRSSK